MFKTFTIIIIPGPVIAVAITTITSKNHNVIFDARYLIVTVPAHEVIISARATINDPVPLQLHERMRGWTSSKDFARRAICEHSYA